MASEKRILERRKNLFDFSLIMITVTVRYGRGYGYAERSKLSL